MVECLGIELNAKPALPLTIFFSRFIVELNIVRKNI